MDLVNSLEGRLLFAVPKKGRLLQAALNLLEGADIQFKRESRLDIALVKNLPIALVFLPAADIPTFVGEGRVDLGITGYDQVQEHDAGVRAIARARRMSNEWSPKDEKPRGCDTILDLGFGSCKLQIQVPAKGEYQTGKDLIGKNIGTSFVHLASEYFARLELEQEGIKVDSTASYAGRKLRTKIIELSGSVEAACALGVADGIVDLVGMLLFSPMFILPLTNPIKRIRRNNESRRSQSHRNRGRNLGHPHQVKGPLQPSHGRPHRRPHQRRHHGPKVRPLPVQRPPRPARRRDKGHPRQARPHRHLPRGGRLGRRQRYGREEADRACYGRPHQGWRDGYSCFGHSQHPWELSVTMEAEKGLSEKGVGVWDT
ncbi:uncharacterized protein PODANS_1_12370 [Podospora anserina S mat+]|uniref:ATP phosphoribosyltransferase n=1 Tax=Podospora anserina (strain S / ATCC MYA-4624 / DSM 980 / FGSC 10383) TaxID=515849 RepID=B2AYV5_PODAN|nr:uncharacterized protein PODANS_1_12370 [Podospora anserina S mat+]CAP69579.1 unnamed protein product [Podospora anserina S mat+]CDP23595.1 Putative ATP phosphoribosyltransferase [Podospora anserina S mat+]